MSSAVARNKSQPEEPLDPEGEKRLVDEFKRKSDSPELRPHDERESDRMQSSKRIPLDICNREGVEI